jgi:alpha-tubulin suppressor-like RCC1 family protein
VPNLLGVAEVAAGAYHTCARMNDGTVRCWGDGAFLTPPDGGAPPHRPTVVAGIAGVVQIAVGFELSCARLNTGGVRCWGPNRFGELGDGTTTPRTTPNVPVAGLNAAGTTLSIGVGDNYACALVRDGGGTVRCWGYNGSGQLGDNTTTNRSQPVAVTGLAGVAQLSVGTTSVCAWRLDDAAFCWGDNHVGQLGDGTTTERHVPTPVQF